MIEKEEIIITYLPYNLEFVYIPSGTFYKGLSDVEFDQARKICLEKLFEINEMRPLTKLSLRLPTEDEWEQQDLFPNTMEKCDESIKTHGELLETVIIEDVFMPEILQLLSMIRKQRR